MAVTTSSAVQDVDYSGGSGSGSSINDSARSLAHLPKELLAQVMRKLSARQRFSGCALTCCTLLAAAVATTKELQHSNISQQRADSIALWLAKHSSKTLQRLNLEGRMIISRPSCGLHCIPVRLTMRCDKLSHLEQLTLCRLVLQQHPASTSTSSSWSQLSTLTHLRRLVLAGLQQDTASISMAEATAVAAAGVVYGAELGAALGQLVQLTALELSAAPPWRLDGLALAHASSLSQLQHMALNRVGTEEHQVQLQSLPGSLSSLHLDMVVTSSRQMSSSRQMPQLQELKLFLTDVAPALMLHMSQLQTLYWYPHSILLVHGVLNVLPRLQNLSTLCITDIMGESAALDFAALTASSRLAELRLCQFSMAVTAAQHMFEAGRLLPHLHTISVKGMSYEVWNDAAPECHGLIFGPGDAARLAACCPGLQSLGSLVLEEDVTVADLQPLQQLTALTYLEIGGLACDDDVVAQVLANMAGLMHLDVMCGRYLTAEGCAHLTRLTALTELRLRQCSALRAGRNAEDAGDAFEDCDDVHFLSMVADAAALLAAPALLICPCSVAISTNWGLGHCNVAAANDLRPLLAGLLPVQQLQCMYVAPTIACGCKLHSNNCSASGLSLM